MMTDPALFALSIFTLRVVESALGAVRLVFLTRGWRWASMALAFIEALIFALATAGVLTTLSENVANLLAYCLGYAVGVYLGMGLEARFVTSYVTVKVVTTENGEALAALIREQGHGATSLEAQGAGGTVTLIRSVIARQNVSPLLAAIHQDFPRAFVTLEEARAVRRGWMRAVRNQK